LFGLTVGKLPMKKANNKNIQGCLLNMANITIHLSRHPKSDLRCRASCDQVMVALAVL
jgi:hypothetical protein